MPAQVNPPITERQLARADDGSGVVQIRKALSEDDARLLSSWLTERPTITLRAYGPDPSLTDLEFLKWLPGLRGLSVSAGHVTDLGWLRHLPDDLATLELELTSKKKRPSLEPIARFQQLERLTLRGHYPGLPVISRLGRLSDLWLSDTSLSNLEPLLPLEQLHFLSLAGGTTDISLLPQVGRLHHVKLGSMAGLADLSPVGQLTQLELLFVSRLSSLRAMPDFSAAKALTHVSLESLENLIHLGGLTTAPDLQHVSIVRETYPPEIARLTACPSLQTVRVDFGSEGKNRQAADVLGPLYRPRTWQDAWQPDLYWK